MKCVRSALILLVAVGIVVPAVFAADTEPLTKPPKGDGWVPLFNGKNLDGWHLKGTPNDHNFDSWTVACGVLVNVPPDSGVAEPKFPEKAHGIDLVSDVELGSHELYIEFMVPKGSNSGVYLIGQYEIQVLDSYQKDPDKHQCGGIYDKIAPIVNVSKAPGEWQCYHAIFHKPEVKNGKVVKGTSITVYQNGQKVVDKFDCPGVTGAALSNEIIETGPTYLQGNHGMVFYRNIYYKPIKD